MKTQNKNKINKEVKTKSWIESVLHGYKNKNLRKYSKEEYLKFFNDHKARDIDENKVDSKNEARFISELKRKDPDAIIKGQNLAIPYEFYGNDKNYFPDLFVLTPNNYIAIIELKHVSKMNQEFNLKKYEALKKLCKKYGFLYLYCDSRLHDYELLGAGKYKLSNYAITIFDRILKQNGVITIDDVEEVTNNKTARYKRWFWLQLAIYTKTNHLKQYGKDYGDLRIH